MPTAVRRRLANRCNYLDDLLANGLRPNTETFNALLSHAQGQKQQSKSESNRSLGVDFMLRQLEAMRLSNVKPTQRTFAIILEFCATHKHREMAHQMLAMIDEL